MKQADVLSNSYTERLDEILKIAWRVLKTRFIEGRHEISKEAPFQHYFANIITTVGDSFCTKREDIFLVDLERKCEGIKGKNKYIDITCEFPGKASCAIELKFKTNRQGAQDHGRIDAFVDIEALELVCKGQFDVGRFYMITDSTPYINESQRGVGTVFKTHDGAMISSGEYHYPSKGRDDVVVKLSGEYVFEWEQVGGWYFLQVNIN
jgi:hypothetical protein